MTWLAFETFLANHDLIATRRLEKSRGGLQETIEVRMVEGNLPITAAAVSRTDDFQPLLERTLDQLRQSTLEELEEVQKLKQGKPDV
jgi:hypothetical protein